MSNPSVPVSVSPCPSTRLVVFLRRPGLKGVGMFTAPDGAYRVRLTVESHTKEFLQTTTWFAGYVDSDTGEITRLVHGALPERASQAEAEADLRRFAESHDCPIMEETVVLTEAQDDAPPPLPDAEAFAEKHGACAAACGRAVTKEYYPFCGPRCSEESLCAKDSWGRNGITEKQLTLIQVLYPASFGVSFPVRGSIYRSLPEHDKRIRALFDEYRQATWDGDLESLTRRDAGKVLKFLKRQPYPFPIEWPSALANPWLR